MMTKKTIKPKTQEQIDKEELTRYYKSICSTEMNYAAFYSQLKKIMEDNPSFTYNGLKYTLWYCINHQGMEITSISIAPYYYNEAKNYHKWLNGIKKYVSAYENKDIEKTISREIKTENIFD